MENNTENRTNILFQNSEIQTCNDFDKIEEECLGQNFLDADRFSTDRNRPVTFENAARERTRVKTLRGAFLELQRTLPAVPPDTKLSKLDVLVLATTYIAHLMRTLNMDEDENQVFAANGIMHPVKVRTLVTSCKIEVSRIIFTKCSLNFKSF